MELRRALLLFAIVLGVAAVVAALAGPSSRRSSPDTSLPAPADLAEPAPAKRAADVRLSSRDAPTAKRLEVGRATTLRVSVDEPGQVQVQGLGLTDAAEPRDPAIFELLPTRRARYEVLFTPAGGVRARALGELVSRPTK